MNTRPPRAAVSRTIRASSLGISATDCVVAIAVRRLHDHAVGAFRRPGIANDRKSPAPDVGRKDEPPLRISFRALEHDRRRSEDVTRVDEGRANAWGNVHRRVISDADHAAHDLGHVSHGVQRRRHRSFASREELGVFFLDVRGIGEHDRAEIVCRGRNVDRFVEPVAREQRQPARVVDVGV